jgi:SAM-dependent methyltransferase
MSLDVFDLRDFYATALGVAARRMLHVQLRAMWPDVSGMRVLGFGYPAPYLAPFLDQAERVVAVMPAHAGVLAWPSPGAGEANLTTVAHEDEIPMADLSVDRIVVVHGLEFAESTRHLLREMWRILSDGGRLIVVVPNRRSMWARADHTPFGHGHPYSTDQLNRVLRQSMFTPVRHSRALFFPPSRRRFWVTAAPAWERIGTRWFNPLGGATIVEAKKQSYGGALVGAKSRRRAYAPIPVGAPSSARSVNRDGSGKSPAR